jgi:hypothetical protein
MVTHMDTGRLLWILRGLVVAFAAIPIGISFANTTASNSANTPSHAVAKVPTPVASTTTEAPPAIQPTVRVALPPGQVWECVLNGQRTFSDTRCGVRSSIRQLSQLNIMDATEVSPVTSFDRYSSGYIPAAADQNTPDSANDLYPYPEVYVINGRTTRGHLSRHGYHGHARPRKN